jgi:cytochrome o ubiquinol oxidase operon protein cyoD
MSLPPGPAKCLLVVIGVAAVIPVLVHLRYFLHMDLTTTPRENLLAILFAAVLILIMVGGKLLDHARPAPSDGAVSA